MALRRTLHLLLNLAVFGLCYTVANLAAQRAGVTRHIVFGIDSAIAFIPWMVVPYMTSGALFVASFWVARDDRVLSARLLFATIAASLIFVLYPLRISGTRPLVDAAFPSALLELLALVDQPYNQFPSLHVAYCVIFGTVFRSAVGRAWLALVAVSTLFTWQHHAIDVAGGLLLGAAAIALVRKASVAFNYVMGAGVLALTCPWPLALYPLAIALAYARADADFLRKRGAGYPLSSYLLYWPYLLGYWMTWQCVRRYEKTAFRQMTAQLLAGRRLSASEAAMLPPGCAVIDLANELSETPALRGAHYVHVPMLDLVAPPMDAIELAVGAVARHIAAGRIVYLHCAMGYSRSIFIANLYMERHPHDRIDLPAQATLPATAAPPA